MPPRKAPTRQTVYPLDDEGSQSVVDLDRQVSELGKELSKKQQQILGKYHFEANEIKKRTQDRLCALGSKANRSRSDKVKQLAKLLERREATQVAIVTKLASLQRELSTFERYFRAGYMELRKRAIDVPVCARSSQPDTDVKASDQR